MLRLPPRLPEPEWLGDIPSDDANDPRPFLLPGVRVRFAPIGPKAFRAAREACLAVLSVAADDTEEASDAISRELIRRGICGWEGVGDASGAALTEPDPAAVALFVAHTPAFLAAESAYVSPYLLRDAEGNSYAGSPSGTGAGATPAETIASSPAAQPDPVDAPQIREAPAKPAPTSSTSRKPRKRKLSGKS